MSHTPGPWTVQASPVCYHVVSADRGFETGCIDFDGNGLANANLIAAAPDLLAACKRLKSYYEDNDMTYYVTNGVRGDSEIYVQLCAAIAKAEWTPDNKSIVEFGEDHVT